MTLNDAVASFTLTDAHNFQAVTDVYQRDLFVQNLLVTKSVTPINEFAIALARQTLFNLLPVEKGLGQ